MPRLSVISAKSFDAVVTAFAVAVGHPDLGVHVFAMTGADSNTEWLQRSVELDSQGFIKTGRTPYLLETSLRGVFAVGDIRAGSVKRVASAAGEGSMAVQFVHMVLAK